MRRIYKVNASDCEQYYEVLRFCDRLSLILSGNEVPTNERRLEINKSMQGERYFIHQKDGIFHVEPWPFKECFTITSEVHLLKKVQFKTNQELKKHLLDSVPILKTWRLAD